MVSGNHQILEDGPSSRYVPVWRNPTSTYQYSVPERYAPRSMHVNAMNGRYAPKIGYQRRKPYSHIRLHPHWSKASRNHEQSGMREASFPLVTEDAVTYRHKVGDPDDVEDEYRRTHDSVKLMNVCRHVWEKVAERDTLDDVNKKNNSSNFERLKDQQLKQELHLEIAQFDSQIKGYVANPDTMVATWQVLCMLFDESALHDYISGQDWDEGELSSSLQDRQLSDGFSRCQ